MKKLNTPPEMSESEKVRFWSTIENKGECIIWNGTRDGQFTANRIRYQSAIIAQYLYSGKWPENRVLKKCGNRHCIKREHIFEANQLDSGWFRERFWSRVQPSTDDKCWPWMRSTTTFGYGQIYVGETAYTAHRLAFYFANGQWPNVATHKCDNPICCNPSHIEDGTYRSNMKDRSARGRCNSARGSRQGHSKFTEETVLLARQDHKTGDFSYGKLCEKYHVSHHTMWSAINHKTWRHI